MKQAPLFEEVGAPAMRFDCATCLDTGTVIVRGCTFIRAGFGNVHWTREEPCRCCRRGRKAAA